MASGLEQTRRNSAILGCLDLSSIFASFFTFLKFAFPAGRQPNQDQVASIWDRTADWIGLRIGSDRIGLVFSLLLQKNYFEKSCF